MLGPSKNRLTTTADPTRLLDVDLVIFDFDGTLYEGTGFLAPHLAELQAAVGPTGPDLTALYEQVTAGEHVLQLGDLFHFGDCRILRPVAEPPPDRFGLQIDEVLDLDGQPAEPPAGLEDGHVPFDAPVTYVGDPWQIAAALSRSCGVDTEQRRDAFSTVRVVMNTPEYDLGIPACLPQLLDRFAHVPDRVLVTNTGEELGREAVARVGVADRFTEVVFGASKPAGLASLLATRLETGLDPARVLCVGDNYWNDILPAYQLGAQSVLVDPFHIGRISEHPLHLSELTQLEQILAGDLVPSARSKGVAP